MHASEVVMADETLAGKFPKEGAIPEQWKHTPDETGLTLLVDGKLSRWDGPSQEIRSAVCEMDDRGRLNQVSLGRAARASGDEGRRAVKSAAQAWAGGRGDWPRASMAERIACVEQFVKRAAPLRERIARALMWEVGKPYADCLVEYDRTFGYITDTIETLRQLERDQSRPVVTSGFVARIRRAPLGVALCMGPYNYALNETFTTVIPAVVMGNPVVIKTPRYGVLANALLAGPLAESFPPGVVSLLTGSGSEVVGPIMETGLVDVLAFIGASRTAGI